MAYHWIMGLLISLYFGYFATELAWLVISEIAGLKKKTTHYAHYVLVPSWLTGLVERLFFTILIGLGLEGVIAGMMGWLALKLAANWNHGGRSNSEAREQERIRASAFRAILSGLVSMLFAYWGGIFIHGR